MRPITTTVIDELDGRSFQLLSTKGWHMTGLQSLEALKDWATLQAEQYGLAVIQQQRLAQERARQAKEERCAQEALQAKNQDMLQLLPPAHWGRAILFLAAALVGLVAEFTITWVTIPFMMDLKRRSFEAILLSLSPAVATLALDVVIDRLVDRPWRAAQAALGGAHTEQGLSANRRMGRFLLLVAGIVVLMFVALGFGRIEGAHWQDLLQQGMVESLQMARPVALDLAIVALSVGVLFTTGLFLLLGMQDARTCALHVTTARTVQRDRRRVQQARQEEAEAVAEAARCDKKLSRKTQLMVCVEQLIYRLQVEQLRNGQPVPQDEIMTKVKSALNQMFVPAGGAAS
jgi:hypothetical protein